MQWLRAVAAWPWRSAVLGAEITVMGEGDGGGGGFQGGGETGRG